MGNLWKFLSTDVRVLVEAFWTSWSYPTRCKCSSTQSALQQSRQCSRPQSVSFDSVVMEKQSYLSSVYWWHFAPKLWMATSNDSHSGLFQTNFLLDFSHHRLSFPLKVWAQLSQLWEMPIWEKFLCIFPDRFIAPLMDVPSPEHVPLLASVKQQIKGDFESRHLPSIPSEFMVALNQERSCWKWRGAIFTSPLSHASPTIILQIHAVKKQNHWGFYQHIPSRFAFNTIAVPSDYIKLCLFPEFEIELNIDYVKLSSRAINQKLSIGPSASWLITQQM